MEFLCQADETRKLQNMKAPLSPDFFGAHQVSSTGKVIISACRTKTKSYHYITDEGQKCVVLNFGYGI